MHLYKNRNRLTDIETNQWINWGERNRVGQDGDMELSDTTTMYKIDKHKNKLYSMRKYINYFVITVNGV